MKKRHKALRKLTKKPLKWSMVGMLLLGWLLPLMLITFCMMYFVSSMISGQIEKTIKISAEKAMEICDFQMGETITASKFASYNPTIGDSYDKYRKDGNWQQMYTEVMGFLNQQYKYNGNFLCTMLFFMDSPQEVFYTYNTYRDNNLGNGGYTRMLYFRDNVQKDVIAKSDELDTGIHLFEYGGHVYIVRNLMDSMFNPYGMIVLELDAYSIFTSLDSIWGALEYEIYADGEPLLGAAVGEGFDMNLLNTPTDSSIYIHGPSHSYVYNVEQQGRQRISYLVELDSRTIIDDLFMIRYIVVLIIIFMIPLVIMIFRFFHTKVTKPVGSLVSAATQIALGNYGHKIEQESNSMEFEYLDRAFNTMSQELKLQFEKIYLEELALKDANIMALQSQINPHFLNNTLEIINWEARMNGNDTVSAMIEALATMLDATMNRKQKRFVTLKDELTYVDAYLYIISRRFGERFRVTWETDESLLEVMVPLLIIQPIVENAVDHGVASGNGGEVTVRIYRQEEKMFIEVVNDGELTEEDKTKIEYLLGGKKQEDTEKHISLGIRNVNQRLQIIYGKDCGLTITSTEDKKTVSRIIVTLD